MNTWQSKTPLINSTTVWRLPMRLWRGFQVWRGNRKLAEANRLLEAGMHLIDVSVTVRNDAARLIGRNAQAPSDLFDRGRP